MPRSPKTAPATEHAGTEEAAAEDVITDEAVAGDADGEPLDQELEPADPDEQAARRSLRLAGAALLAAVIGAVVLVATLVLSEDDEAERAEGPTQLPPAAVPVAEPADSIGPIDGVELAPYVERRQSELETAQGQRVAVVSLVGYRTEVDARRLAGGDAGAEALALLVALPGSEPGIVRSSVAEWATALQQTVTAERTEIETLLPTVDDPEFAEFYRSEVVRLGTLADAATRAADPTAGIVFAVAVKADADTLRELATSPDVRLVDISESSEATANATYYGLRPEEQAVAGDPQLRPA